MDDDAGGRGGEGGGDDVVWGEAAEGWWGEDVRMEDGMKETKRKKGYIIQIK